MYRAEHQKARILCYCGRGDEKIVFYGETPQLCVALQVSVFTLPRDVQPSDASGFAFLFAVCISAVDVQSCGLG